jgi:hypothetical protein
MPMQALVDPKTTPLADAMCKAQAVSEEPPFPCPCCGYRVFREEPGSYDICPVCGWEDDLSQLRFPTMGGANAPLVECQKDHANPRDWEHPTTTPEEMGYEQDAGWRPIDLDQDQVQVPLRGVEYGMTYAADRTTYYYWRTRATE